MPTSGGQKALDDANLNERALMENNGYNLLQTVWKDGKFVKELSFDEVRKNAGYRLVNNPSLTAGVVA